MATVLPGDCPCNLKAKGVTPWPCLQGVAQLCWGRQPGQGRPRFGLRLLWVNSLPKLRIPNWRTFGGNFPSRSLSDIPWHRSSPAHLRNCFLCKGFWTPEAEDWMNHIPQFVAHNYLCLVQGASLSHSFIYPQPIYHWALYAWCFRAHNTLWGSWKLFNFF